MFLPLHDKTIGQYYLMKKTVFFLLLASLLSFSCSKEKESEDVSSIITDAQIYSIRLVGDTINSPALKDATFSIDQINNQIQNKDSLPFGTVVNTVKCIITTKGASRTIFYPDAENMADSILWNGIDSIDLSKKARFKVIAKDGVSSKTYDIKTNTYSINADLFVWQQTNARITSSDIEQQRTVLMPDSFMHLYIKTSANCELYRSHINDGVSWVKRELSNFPSNANTEMMPYCKSHLYVADTDGILYQSADGIAWTKADVKDASGQDHPVKTLLGCISDSIEVITGIAGSYSLGTFSPSGNIILKGALPDNFPIEGFASVSYNKDFRNRLLLVAGNNISDTNMETSWMKTEGQEWIEITAGNKRISPRRGAVCIPYDGKLLLIGGLDKSGSKKDIYFSPDYGMNWIPDSLETMPENFKARAGASILVDNKNYVHIVGGEETTETGRKALNDIWRGRIHRLAK